MYSKVSTDEHYEMDVLNRRQNLVNEFYVTKLTVLGSENLNQKLRFHLNKKGCED